eukprot:681274-Amphidinium_carterae.4
MLMSDRPCVPGTMRATGVAPNGEINSAGVGLPTWIIGRSVPAADDESDDYHFLYNMVRFTETVSLRAVCTDKL